MRILNYPFEANKARILDAYDKVWGEFVLKQGKNELPLTQRGFKIQDSYKNIFYIHEGFGELEWGCVTKKYDFSKLEPYLLDFFLYNGEYHAHTTEAEKRLINEFVEVYELNLDKGENYLLPFGFALLDSKLSVGGY